MPASPIGQALMLLALLLAWPLGRWLGGRGYDAYGLDLQPSSFRLLGGGLSLAALAKLASVAAGLAVGAYAFPAGFQAGTVVHLSFLAIAALTTLVPSVVEDILTRGFLLRTIPLRLGLWPYVLLSAALYTANHIWRFGWGPSEQLRLFCLGLAYAAIAWRWRTLWGAVALHWGWNFANALAGVILPVDALGVTGGRLVSAGAHLALLAIVLLLPAPRREGA
jgi:membrane protease YdiL (CAAX protease family)